MSELRLRAHPSNEDIYLFIDYNGNENEINRTYIALALQALSDKITERLNFMTATYDEAKYANKDWKRIRGLPIT